MAKHSIFARRRWAIFTAADCWIQSTFAFSRKAAIEQLKLDDGETWKDKKKRGWYTAQIKMTWEKFDKTK